jgi:hypothetical protein
MKARSVVAGVTQIGLVIILKKDYKMFGMEKDKKLFAENY